MAQTSQQATTSPRHLEILYAERGGGQCGAERAFIDRVVVHGQVGIPASLVVGGRSLGSFTPASLVWIDRTVEGNEQAAFDQYPRGLGYGLVELGVVQRGD